MSKIFQHTAITILSLAVGLAGAELCVRAATRWPMTDSLDAFSRYMNNADRHYYLTNDPMFRRSTDPDLGWEAIPGTYSDGMVRINQNGFRGPERVIGRPEGMRRLAFLGDSEVFGQRLPEGDTLPSRLEAELARRGAPHQVLNFGVVGYNTEQEFALLRKIVVGSSPDIVLVYYVFNDPELPERILHFQGSRSLRDSYLYNLALWVGTMRLRDQPPSVPFEGSFVQYYNRLHDSQYFERVKELLAEMGAYCAERRTRFVVAIAPEVFEVEDLGEHYPYEGIHARLRALASPTVEVIDPRPALAAEWDPRDPKALWVTTDDPHKNARANAAIARALADALLATPLTPDQDPAAAPPPARVSGLPAGRS